MIILPAIDMIGGKPVRLYQGDYGSQEIVADSVIETAKRFEEAGAHYIHMVDLDGAKSGRKENAQLVTETAQILHTPVEVGGGIRTMEDISFYLDRGVSRVILGTAAINDPDLLKAAIDRYGEKIAVGMDCRNGYACASGWLEQSELYYIDFAKRLQEMGVTNIIFTDISRDGTLSGPNLEMLKELCGTVTIDITASGGIHNMDDLRELKELGVYGAITGKAVYSGAIDLKEAVRLCEETL